MSLSLSPSPSLTHFLFLSLLCMCMKYEVKLHSYNKARRLHRQKKKEFDFFHEFRRARYTITIYFKWCYIIQDFINRINESSINFSCFFSLLFFVTFCSHTTAMDIVYERIKAPMNAWNTFSLSLSLILLLLLFQECIDTLCSALQFFSY